MSLTGKSPSETYKDLTYVDNSNSGVDSTTRSVKTGNGSETSLSLSDRAVKIKSSTDNTAALDVQNSSGTSKLLVDTTNSQVKALGNHVNTQYAYFSQSLDLTTSGLLANAHYALGFNSMKPQAVVTVGTGITLNATTGAIQAETVEQSDGVKLSDKASIGMVLALS